MDHTPHYRSPLRARRRARWLACLASAFLGASVAAAQEVALPDPEPVHAPASPYPASDPDIALDVDREIDLANIVTSAAKGVTTVQEAPAIISIITSDEIKARGFRWIEDAFSTVPGWQMSNALGDQIIGVPIVRGVAQSALLLRDGVSQFDPFGNNQFYHNNVPLESVKRLEIVTGPGGVLWGANSFMGIVNVIMKDAEDVNGLELNAGYGDGPGYRQHFKGYLLYGKSFLDGRLKIFQHVSYESYIGPTWNIPNHLATSPAPQPTGPAYWGPAGETYPARSWVLTVDGKISVGPVSLLYQIPFADVHQQLTFASAVVPDNRTNIIDRYVTLQYKSRFGNGLFGVDAKAYWAQFVSNISPQLFPSQAQFPSFSGALGNNIGGVRFDINPQYQSLIQRTGLTLDTDLDLRHGLRLLLGGELFYESVSGSIERFLSAPYSDPSMATTASGAPVVTATPAGLPILCPTKQNGDGTFTYVPGCPRQFVADQYRWVGALYADLHYRPVDKLTIDGGVRVQKGFGGRPYDWTPLYSAAVVWNFAPDHHLKLNYSTGFRPPTFINTDSVSGGINYGPNPSLKNEQSQSFQGELNARLLHNVRKIRELDLRLDYAYTYLSNLILTRESRYEASGQRGIHSVEAYGKLFLSGDHFLMASYTFLYTITSDSGFVLNSSNHWLSLGGSFNLIRNTLDVNLNLLITGAYTDPNRLPTGTNPLPGATTSSRTTDLTLDRLTPVALLQLGFRLRFFHERLAITGQLYNVLNQRYYHVDPFYDLTPAVELQPNPAPGFNFFTQVSYHF